MKLSNGKVVKMYDLAQTLFKFLVRYVEAFHYVAIKLFEIIVVFFCGAIVLAILVFVTGTFLTLVRVLFK